MKTHVNRILLRSTILLILVLSNIAAQAKRVHRTVDAGTILYLFQNKVYNSLNTKLQVWQTAFEKDYLEEENVYEAFEVFSSADPFYEVILNSWVNQLGHTYPPYVARAKYYIACGWNARGHKFASQTTEEQFEEMKRSFALALDDMKSALLINPKLDICYDMMITIGMTISDDLLKKNALAEALKNNPYGYKVRSSYLHTLTPRWGGSYKEMEEFVEESEKYAANNPKLKSLRGQIFADKANIFWREDNYEQAILHYTNAIQYREYAPYYAERGDCYYTQHDYRRALNDYESALDLKPNSPDYLRKKSNALYRLNRLSDAQETIEEASKLDPNDQFIQKRKDFYESDGVKSANHTKQGIELLKAGRYEEAILEFTEAIRLNSDESANFYDRALCYHNLGQFEDALKDYNEVLIRQRDHIKSYNAIGAIQYHLKRFDESLRTVKTLLKLDPGNPEAYYNRALVYLAKDLRSEALSDARQACSLGYQRACPLVNQLQ